MKYLRKPGDIFSYVDIRSFVCRCSCQKCTFVYNVRSAYQHECVFAYCIRYFAYTHSEQCVPIEWGSHSMFSKTHVYWCCPLLGGPNMVNEDKCSGPIPEDEYGFSSFVSDDYKDCTCYYQCTYDVSHNTSAACL